MINTALVQLFAKTKTIDLNARHGAVLAIGEIFKALSTIAHNEQKTTLQNLIGNELLDYSKLLIPTFQERLYFRGLGGELMRQACSTFIQNCSLAQMPFHGSDVIGNINNFKIDTMFLLLLLFFLETWFALLNDCIAYDVPHIRAAAISALPSFIAEYYKGTDQTMKTKRSNIIDKYIKNLKVVNTEVMRMGHALALGALPAFMLKDNLDGILDALVSVTYITPETLKWAESRRDAAKAITSVCVNLNGDIKTGWYLAVINVIAYTIVLHQ